MKEKTENLYQSLEEYIQSAIREQVPGRFNGMKNLFTEEQKGLLRALSISINIEMKAIRENNTKVFEKSTSEMASIMDLIGETLINYRQIEKFTELENFISRTIHNRQVVFNNMGMPEEDTEVSRQFKIAKDYFALNPTKTKFSRKDAADNTNSFMKIGDQVYMLGHDPQKNEEKNKAIIGKGGFGTAKFALSEKKEVFVIKILTRTSWVDAKKELALGKKVGLTNNDIYAKNVTDIHCKLYLALFFAGPGLGEEIKKLLSLEERIDLAIKLCDSVVSLHEKKIIHLDIKPDNIAILNGRISLIDFGNSKDVKDIKENISDDDAEKGTPAYKCSRESVQGERTYELVDMFALKRTLYMPSPNKLNRDSIFQKKIMRSYH